MKPSDLGGKKEICGLFLQVLSVTPEKHLNEKKKKKKPLTISDQYGSNKVKKTKSLKAVNERHTVFVVHILLCIKQSCPQSLVPYKKVFD